MLTINSGFNAEHFLMWPRPLSVLICGDTSFDVRDLRDILFDLPLEVKVTELDVTTEGKSEECPSFDVLVFSSGMTTSFLRLREKTVFPDMPMVMICDAPQAVVTFNAPQARRRILPKAGLTPSSLANALMSVVATDYPISGRSRKFERNNRLH